MIGGDDVRKSSKQHLITPSQDRTEGGDPESGPPDYGSDFESDFDSDEIAPEHLPEDETQAHTGRRRALLGLLAILVLAAIIWMNREALAEVLGPVKPTPAWLIPLAMMVLQVVITGLRAAVLLGPAGRTHPGTCVACHIMGQVANQFAPSGAGDFVVKGACLSRRLKLPFRRMAGLVVVDRLFDVLIAVALAPAAVLYLTGRLDSETALILAGVLLAVLPPAAQAALQPAMAGLDKVVAARRGEEGRLTLLVRGLHTLYAERRGVLPPAYLVSLLRYAAMVGGLGLLHVFLLGPAPWVALILGAALVQFAMLLPLAPGGLGVVEGAWYAILVAAGIASGPALAFALFVRAYLVLGNLAAGGLALLLTGGLRLSRREPRGGAPKTER